MALVKETGDGFPMPACTPISTTPRRAGTAGDFAELPPFDDLPAQPPPAAHHGGDRDYAELPREPWEN
jgi:hypothetical protein